MRLNIIRLQFKTHHNNGTSFGVEINSDHISMDIIWQTCKRFPLRNSDKRLLIMCIACEENANASYEIITQSNFLDNSAELVIDRPIKINGRKHAPSSGCRSTQRKSHIWTYKRVGPTYAV